jgi:hypothetical protein
VLFFLYIFYFSGGMSEGVSLKVKLSLSMVFVEVFLLILSEYFSSYLLFYGFWLFLHDP